MVFILLAVPFENLFNLIAGYTLFSRKSYVTFISFKFLFSNTLQNTLVQNRRQAEFRPK